MGEIIQSRDLSGGHENTSYLIETSDHDYIFTICNEKSMKDVQELTSLLRLLENNDIKTSIPIKNRVGNYISIYEELPSYMKLYIPGEYLKDPSMQDMKVLAHEIAKIHKIDPPNYIQTNLPYGINHFHEVIKNPKMKHHQFAKWLKQRVEYIKHIINLEYPTGLIHSDLFNDNIIKGNKEIVIIDFEEASNSEFIFDLGMTIVGTCSKDMQIHFKLSKALIQSYSEKRTMSNKEAFALQDFTVYAATCVAFWRFRQYNIKFPNSLKSDSYIEMMRLATNISKIDTAIFMRKLGLNQLINSDPISVL